jgi:hypothetical protein
VYSWNQPIYLSFEFKTDGGIINKVVTLGTNVIYGIARGINTIISSINEELLPYSY